MDLTKFELNSLISLTLLCSEIPEANQISVIIVNSSKNIEISPELQNRLQKFYLNKYVTCGNKLSLMFYGKRLIFEVKSIQNFEQKLTNHCKGGITSLEEKLKQLSTNYTDCFYRITDKTNWSIFRCLYLYITLICISIYNSLVEITKNLQKQMK